jgi:TatD DNase family protein
MIDTHIHLNDNAYNDILNEIIQSANNNGINKMIVIGCDYQSSLKAIEIAKKYENIYAMVGLHPSEVDHETDSDLNWLKELLLEDKVIGVGEIGIDLYWTKENKDLQIEYFEKQLQLSLEYNLPVSIHSRDAIELTYQILSKNKYKGVIHCFSGSLEMANKFIKLGYLIGIGGVVTFKNTNLKDVVRNIPMESIITETDGPYLAPTPFRGKMNKPEYIKLIVDEIASLKSLSVNEVEMQIDKNVKKVFNI